MTPVMVIVCAFIVFGSGFLVGSVLMLRRKFVHNMDQGDYRVIAVTADGGSYLRVIVYKNKDEEESE